MARPKRCPHLVAKTSGKWREYICTRDPGTPCPNLRCELKTLKEMDDEEEA